MKGYFSTSLFLLDSKLNLLPNQTIPLDSNITGAILFTNKQSETGTYLLTFAGLKTTGTVLPNETKLITYSSSEAGTLQNTGTITLEVCIT